MRIDPPDPPATPEPTAWWTRTSHDPDLGTHRTMYAKVVSLVVAEPWPGLSARAVRAIIEFYGDLSIGPAFVQRYSSREKAEQVLTRRGWTRTLEAVAP